MLGILGYLFAPRALLHKGDVRHLLAHAALVYMDVQKGFCDPSFLARGNAKTARALAHILELKRAFEHSVMPSFVVLYSKRADEIPPLAYAGGPAMPFSKSDILIMKDEDSALAQQSSDFENKLHDLEVKRLLICGFNASGCLAKTVRHALRKGFEVTIIIDCAANGAGFEDHDKINSFQKLAKLGASFVNKNDLVASLLAPSDMEMPEPRMAA